MTAPAAGAALTQDNFEEAAKAIGISYTTKDQEFAERLHADLQDKGVRCWFAPRHIQDGKKIHEQIDRAIHFYDRLLLILSKDSMESEWVKTEIAKTRKRKYARNGECCFPCGFSKVSRHSQF